MGQSSLLERDHAPDLRNQARRRIAPGQRGKRQRAEAHDAAAQALMMQLRIDLNEPPTAIRSSRIWLP